MLTEKEASLAFPLNEVPELKKTSRGVKAVTFEKNDAALIFATALPAAEETFLFKGKTISVEFDRPVALQIDGETILGVTKYEACIPSLYVKKENEAATVEA